MIVLLLGKTTHFNVVIEEYIGGVLLVVSIALVVLTHRRRVGPIPWIFYCPVAFLMLSFVQYQNTIWGFQMAWYLVLLMVMITIAILDRPTLTWWWMVLAIACAVVASFSSLQGLIIWPVGLLLMYYRCRPRATMICWVASAVVTTVLYFIHDNSQDYLDYLAHHPVAGLEFYFISIGDVVGATVSGVKGAGIAVLLLGIVIFLTSIWVLVTYCWGRDQTSGSPIAACLICFGLLFAAVVTEGRTFEGTWVAGSSRYRTFNLLIVVGLYLVLIEQYAVRRHSTMLRKEATNSDGASPAPPPRGSSLLHNAAQRAFPFFAVVVVAVVCAQVAVGIPDGLAGARSIHGARLPGWPGGRQHQQLLRRLRLWDSGGRRIVHLHQANGGHRQKGPSQSVRHRRGGSVPGQGTTHGWASGHGHLRPCAGCRVEGRGPGECHRHRHLPCGQGRIHGDRTGTEQRGDRHGPGLPVRLGHRLAYDLAAQWQLHLEERHLRCFRPSHVESGGAGRHRERLTR